LAPAELTQARIFVQRVRGPIPWGVGPGAALAPKTFASWPYLGGDVGMNMFTRDQEGRDVVQDIIVSVGFWLLVVLFFLSSNC
jgi:hypothetical protein